MVGKVMPIYLTALENPKKGKIKQNTQSDHLNITIDSPGY